MIGKIIDQEREHACDDRVVKHQISPAFYAQTLLTIGLWEKSHVKQQLTLRYSDSSSSQLAKRIRRILKTNPKKPTQRLSFWVGSLLILLISGLLWIQYHPNLQPTKPETSDSRMRIRFQNAEGKDHWILMDSLLSLSHQLRKKALETDTKIVESDWKENGLFYPSKDNYETFRKLDSLFMHAGLRESDAKIKSN